MTDAVLGLKASKMQSLVNKYGCVVRKEDFVDVVTVEKIEKEISFLLDWVSQHGDSEYRKGYCFALGKIREKLLEAVRLQVKKEVKK